MGRRFARHIDIDLVAKIENGWKPHSQPEAMKRVKPARLAASYRAARRNETLRGDVKGTWKGVEARHLPWLAKPPIIKFNWALIALGKSPVVGYRERKQPKDYPYSSKRQNARHARRLAA